MHRQCNVTKRVRTAKGLRYCPVVIAANRQIKPDLVLVNDQENDIPKAPIISNGAKKAGGCACRWARTRLTRV